MIQTFFSRAKKSLKIIIHKYEVMEAILFFLWGIWSIVRAYWIFASVPQAAKHRKRFTVIIPTIRSFPIPGLVYFDAVFAHAFHLLGAKVFLIFHDGALPSTDSATIFRSERPQSIIERILGPFLKIALRLPHYSYWDFISKKEIERFRETVARLKPQEYESFHFLGVAVGMHARAATIRYFLTGRLNLDDALQRNIFREKLVNAMITAKVASEVVKKEHPQLLFFVHGVYSAWGPWHEYFQKNHIDTIIYGAMTLRFGTFMFNRNSKMNEIASKEVWNALRKKPLLPRHDAAIRAYFCNRAKGSMDDQKMYSEQYAKRLKKERILQRLRAGSFQRRYVMFTNLAWDIAIEGKVSTIFNDEFAWMNEVITWFKKRPSYQLIIKPHPAELVWEKTAEGVYTYINRELAPLPANIVVLKPDVPLTAYDLLTPFAVGLVFNGTLGFELAALGIPVLVAAQRVHYYEAGVVPRIQTKREYFSLLNDQEELRALARRNHALAKQYAYFYLYTSIVRIPFYRRDVWSTIDWQKLKDTKNLFNPHSPIMKIAKKAISREDIIKPL